MPSGCWSYCTHRGKPGWWESKRALERFCIRKNRHEAKKNPKTKKPPNPNPDYSEYFRLVEIIILKINNKIIKLARFTTALSSGGTSSSALLAEAAVS